MLVRGLQKLRDEYEVLGDVRGKGLMLGIELVKDKVMTVGEILVNHRIEFK